MRLLAAALALAALAARPGHGQDIEGYNQLTLDGVTLYNAGAYPQAIDILQQARDAYPVDVNAHYNLGQALKAAGRFEEAVKSYRAAVEAGGGPDGEHENVANALFNEGVCLVNLGQLEEGKAPYRHLLRRDKAHADAHSNLATIFERQDDMEMARKHFRRALKLKPDQALSHTNLGRILKELGEYELAAARYERAIELDPSDPTAYSNLGTAIQAIGEDVEEPIRLYLKTIELDPQHASGWHNLGYSYELFSPERPLGERLAEIGIFDAHDVENPAAFCFRRSQNVSLAGEVNGARAPGQCAMRMVHDWAAEPDVELRVLQEGGEEYGVAAPRVLDPAADLEGFRLAFSSAYNHMFFHEQRVVLATLRDARVAGDAFVVHDECRIFVTGHDHYLWLGEDSDFPPRSQQAVHVPELFVLATVSANNFYHWTAESLSRILLMLPEIRARPRAALLVPDLPEADSFVNEALDRLGLREGGRDIIYHKPSVTVLADTMHVMDWRPTDARPGYEFYPPRAGLRAVRDHFMPRGVLERYPFAERRLVVYLSRNKDGRTGRATLNQDEVLDALRALPDIDLVVFHGSQFSMRDSINLMAQARVIVGVHGAALTNMVFAVPGTAVVEVTMQEPMYRYFGAMAAALDLEYWAVTDVPKNSFLSKVTVPAGKIAVVVGGILDR